MVDVMIAFLCWYFCVVSRGRGSGGAELARNAQGCRQDDGKQPAAKEGASLLHSRQELEPEERTQAMELQRVCRGVLC
jgi:hypothetical protein